MKVLNSLISSPIAVFALIVSALFIFPSVAFSQTPPPVPEVTVEVVVGLVGSILTFAVSYVLRKFVFPKLVGLAFIGIIITVVSPALAWLVVYVAGLAGIVGMSFGKALLFSLLSVIVKAIQTEWIKFATGTPEGSIRKV